MITAEETFRLETSENTSDKLLDWEKQHILDAMTEFAKMHVTEALKQAAEKADLDYFEGRCRECQSNKIDKESILTAYPLENIK